MLIGRVYADRYRVEALREEGVYGRAYKAWETTTGALVELHVLWPELGQVTGAAGQFVAALSRIEKAADPHLRALLDFGVADDQSLYLTYALADHPSLAQHLASQGPLSADAVVAIGKQVAAALTALHAAGCAHGGLTAVAVQVPTAGDATPVQVGFAGLAEVLARAPLPDSRIQSRDPNLLALIQREGGRGPQAVAAEPATDIHALGALLFQAATGGSFFDAVHTASPTPAGRTRAIDAALANIAPALADVIRAATTDRKGDRFQTAGAVATALSNVDLTPADAAASADDSEGKPATRRAVRPTVTLPGKRGSSVSAVTRRELPNAVIPRRDVPVTTDELTVVRDDQAAAASAAAPARAMRETRREGGGLSLPERASHTTPGFQIPTLAARAQRQDPAADATPHVGPPERHLSGPQFSPATPGGQRRRRATVSEVISQHVAAPADSAFDDADLPASAAAFSRDGAEAPRPARPTPPWGTAPTAPLPTLGEERTTAAVAVPSAAIGGTGPRHAPSATMGEATFDPLDMRNVGGAKPAFSVSASGEIVPHAVTTAPADTTPQGDFEQSSATVVAAAAATTEAPPPEAAAPPAEAPPPEAARATTTPSDRSQSPATAEPSAAELLRAEPHPTVAESNFFEDGEELLQAEADDPSMPDISRRSLGIPEEEPQKLPWRLLAIAAVAIAVVGVGTAWQAGFLGRKRTTRPLNVVASAPAQRAVATETAPPPAREEVVERRAAATDEPAQNEPTQNEPTQNEPTQNEPTQHTHTQPRPVQPRKTAPAKAAPEPAATPAPDPPAAPAPVANAQPKPRQPRRRLGHRSRRVRAPRERARRRVTAAPPVGFGGPGEVARAPRRSSTPVEPAPLQPEGAAAVEGAPDGMVAIPAGSWPIGCRATLLGCEANAMPPRRRSLTAFAIQQHEVSAKAYAECVAEGTCSAPGTSLGCSSAAELPDRPANCVTWQQASEYCAWRGWRLPSEAEWEVAARGTGRRQYPWGSRRPSCGLTVMSTLERGPGCGAAGPRPVGSVPGDKSWSGALDMGGNVAEWVASRWRPYAAGPGFRDSAHRSVRGGHYRQDARTLRLVYQRGHAPAASARATIGFRCAVTLK